MRLPHWLRAKRVEDQSATATATPPQAASTQVRDDARRFKTLMFTAKEIARENPAGLYSLISAILRPEQSELILGVAERGQDAKPELFGRTFFVEDLHGHFPAAAPVERTRADYPLLLGRDVILPCPWADARLIAAFSFIGSGKGDPAASGRHDYGGPWTHRPENHHVVLWLPWRIGFVGGGNHSLAAGIIAAEGSFTPDRVEDWSGLLDLMETDGVEYRDRRTGASLGPVTDIRHAAVFEIGRLIPPKAA